jgi:hypothetical protein
MSGYSGTPLARKLGIGARTDLMHLFVTRAAALARPLPRARRAMRADAVIWVSWPKRSSEVATDLSENDVRAFALPLGLVDVKVCAVDETWSGLKLVLRLSERGAAQPAPRR